MGRRFCAAAARTRLDRGSHRRDRVSLGGGARERFAEIAAEFVRLKVDVIVTREPARLAAKQATSVIPIVFARGATRSAPAWSRVWRDRAATSPACRSRRPILLASDSNSCARLSPVSAGWRSWPMSAIPPPCWRWARFRQRPARSASKSSRSKSGGGGGYRARLRGAQGPRGGTLCLIRAAREHQPVRINTLALGARLPTMYALGSTSKREV